MNPAEPAPKTVSRGSDMLKTILRSGWTLALAAGLLAPGTAGAQAAGKARPAGIPALHDGVVVDATRGIAYVMGREGLEALDLTSGNVLWQSRDAAKPLALADGTLVAQARPDRNGVLALVTLDAAKGRATGRTEVQIPGSLRANLVDGPSQTFQVKAFAATGDSVTVTWTGADVIPQGYLPTVPETPQTADTATVKRAAEARETAEAARNAFQGAARLDLEAGRAVAIPFEEADQARPALVVESKTAGEAKAAGGARQLTSLDGRHVLRSEPSSTGGLRTPYRWTVTTASGAQVGTLDAPVSMAPFVVSGSQIFFVAQPSARREEGKILEQPLRLVAFDLRTGVEIWNKSFIDSIYRGPFPP